MTIMPLPGNGAATRTMAHPGAARVSLPALMRTARGALVAWRDRRRAAAHLQRLSDTQLRDIGVTRLDIERAVRGDLDPSLRTRGRHC